MSKLKYKKKKVMVIEKPDQLTKIFRIYHKIYPYIHCYFFKTQISVMFRVFFQWKCNYPPSFGCSEYRSKWSLPSMMIYVTKYEAIYIIV